MPPVATQAGAITPGGVRDGDPQVLAALCARRGPAVLAFARELCEPYATRAAADAFARFRAIVVAGAVGSDIHPDALLLRCARRAALELLPPGPELGCPEARELLAARAERTISAGDDKRLTRHLEICPACRSVSASLAAAKRAYRDVEDEALAPEVTGAIVAALAAAAPVRMPGEKRVVPVSVSPPEHDEEPEIADLRASEAEAVEEPEAPEPVEEPEPAEEEEPEPQLTEEFDPITSEPISAPLAPEPVVTSALPYYEVPAATPRGQRGRERSRRAAQQAGAAAGLAASVTRWAAGSARRRFSRPEPPVSPTPAPLPSSIPIEPIRPEPRVWQPLEDMSFPEPPPQVPDEPPLTPSPIPDPVFPARTRRSSRVRTRGVRTPPPRLLRRHRHRHHLPLRDHSPRELAIPGVLLVAAALVIMAVAGVFGGGSPDPSPPAARIVNTRPAPRPHPELSATAISLADAENAVGPATSP